MIVVRLIGGLGNQMFQYAAAKALALATRQTLRIDRNSFKDYKVHQYGLHHFSIKDTEYSKLDKIVHRIKHLNVKKAVYNETDFRFNPDLHALKGNPLILNGYFQCEDYFIKYKKEIGEAFEISSPLKPITKDLLKKIQCENAVSIHIRRGDYLQSEPHNTDKTDYYLKAIDVIKARVTDPVFYVFSDDMPWVKENFKIDAVLNYIDFNDPDTNFEDMQLMSSCKHNIIANSSFSWWSAWLNKNPEKIVTAPREWFTSTEEMDYQDVVPNDWIKI